MKPRQESTESDDFALGVPTNPISLWAFKARSAYDNKFLSVASVGSCSKHPPFHP